MRLGTRKPGKRAVGLLLSTSSAFALVFAHPAFATCVSTCVDDTNNSDAALASGFTNTGSIEQLLINGGSTVNGSIVNAAGATIGLSGGGPVTAIQIGDGSGSTTTVTGGITNSGTIIGGGGLTSTGILIDTTAAVSGGIVNGGTITTSVTQSSTGFVTASGLCGASTIASFANTGSITATGTNTASSGESQVDACGAQFSSPVTGSVSNSGSITATASASNAGASCAYAQAYGLSVTGGSSGAVSNSGTITVTASTAAVTGEDLACAYGLDVTTASPVSNSGKITATGTGGCGSAYGIDAHGGTAADTVMNSGTITVSMTGSISSSDSPAKAYGIDVSGPTAGAVSNSSTGSITATATGSNEACAEAFGIFASTSGTATVGNAGTIAATASQTGTGCALAYGIQMSGAASGAVSNTGTITVTASAKTTDYSCAAGIYTFVTAAGALGNSGTITASASSTAARDTYAYGLCADSSTSVGATTNSGTLTATASTSGTSTSNATYAYGMNLCGGASVGAVSNTGTITATATGCASAYGIFAEGRTASSVTNSGTITATATGTGVQQVIAWGIEADFTTFTGTIANSGSIMATASAATGCASAYGIQTEGTTFTGTINNTGTIIARATDPTATSTMSAVGIYADNNLAGANTIENSGTIMATVTAPSGLGYAAGIEVAGGSGTLTIANSGTITATDAIDLSHSGTVTTINQNAGTITGNILFSPQADTLNINGGTITGGIAQASGASATVNLTGGTLTVPVGGTVSGIATLAQTGGTLGLQISPPTIASAGAPTLTAGTVHISGGTVTAFETASVFKPGTTYVYSDVINWTASNPGTATPAVTSNSPLFNPSLVSSGNSTAGAYTLDLAAIAPGAVPGLSPAQQSVANALPTPLLAAVTTLNTAQFQQAMTDLSGITRTTMTQSTLDSWENLIGTLGTRLASGGGYQGTLIGSIDGGNIKLASATGQQVADAVPGIGGGNANADQPWGLWVRGFGVWADAPATATGPAYSQNTGGAVVGFDRAVNENVVAGVALDFTNTTTLDAGGAGNSQATNYQLAGYGQYTMGDWYAQGQVGAATETLGESRHVGFLGASPSASFTGQSYAAYGEAGYTLHRAGFLLTPLAGLGYTRVHTDAYTETGGGMADLAVASSDVNSLQTSFGGRAAMRFALANGGEIQPEVSAVWQHEFLSGEPSITSAFTTAPNGTFTITGTRFSRESAVLGVGISSVTAAGPQVFLDYNAKVNGGYLANAVSAGLRIQF